MPTPVRGLWFCTQQRRVLLVSAGPCQGPWRPVAGHSYGFQPSVPAWPGFLQIPNQDVLSLGRNVARAPTGAPGGRDHLSAVRQRLPVRSDGSSSPALRPHLGLGVSQSSPSRETGPPSAWPPRKRPLQPVIETLSRSLVWLVGCRAQRGCPPFPHPALARALGRPVPRPRCPGEPVCCSAVGRPPRK